MNMHALLLDFLIVMPCLFNAWGTWKTWNSIHFMDHLWNHTHTHSEKGDSSWTTAALQHMVLKNWEWKGKTGRMKHEVNWGVKFTHENRQKGREKRKRGIYWRSSFICLILFSFLEALWEKRSPVSPINLIQVPSQLPSKNPIQKSIDLALKTIQIWISFIKKMWTLPL